MAAATHLLHHSADLSPAVRDGAVALPNVPHVVTLGGARGVLWDTAKRRADRLAREHVEALVSLLVHGAERQREDVAAILANAACDRFNRREIAQAGAVPLLVSAVAQADGAHRSFVGKLLRALANVAWQNDENQRQIDASGGVDALIEIFAHGNDLEIQDEAATALSHLVELREIAHRVQNSKHGETLELLAHKAPEPTNAQAAWLLAKIACHSITADDVVADIPALVKLIANDTDASSSDHTTRTVDVLRRLSRDVKYKSEIVVAGGLAPLIRLLQRGSEKQRVDAAWTLGHLAWNAFSEAQIANAGAIPPLIELLQSTSVREREGAAWALRHLSCTSHNRSRFTQSAQGIPSLVKSVRSAGSPCEREHAIATLKNLACSSENETAIGDAGAIPVLVSVLAKGTPSQVVEAVAALRNLVRNNSKNQTQLAQARGIRPLVEMLSSGTDDVRIHAAATLVNLAADSDSQSEIVAEGALPAVLTLTESSNVALLEQLTQLLRNLIWCNEPIQARVGASGVIPRIVAMLQSENDSLTKQAAAVLRNLAWEHPANQERIEQAGAIPVLIKLLSSGTAGQREQSAGAIANLTWNNAIVQEQVASGNGLAPLADLTSRGNEKLQQQAALAIRHFVFNANKKVQVAAPAVIPNFVRLLASGPIATHQQQATWVLANLACNANNKMEIVSSGGIRPLVAVLATGTASQKQYAASAIANLACNHDHKIKIIGAKGIAPLVDLVAQGTDGQKKQAAWALRNLAWNCTEGQSAIADAGGIHALVTLTQTGTDSQKEHAAAAIANLACLEDNQLKISAAGGIDALIQLANRGSEGQKLQAAWAIANLAMLPGSRAAIIDAGGIVTLQRIAATGTPDQQRGAAAALARINDPNTFNNVTHESHAVFRSPSDDSEGSDRPLRDLLRVASARSNAMGDSRAQAPQEIKIGRALYRSIGSVPEIVTRSPPGSNEASMSRSPATRLSKANSFGGLRRTPEHRQHVLHHLPSVQETGDNSPSGAPIEGSRWLIEEEDFSTAPDSLPLRRAHSANPPTRVAVRMPPSPVEPTRTNRPMLPRPSTLGDLLDPHGGYSPPKEQVLRRNIARVQSDLDMIRKSQSVNPANERENIPVNIQGLHRSPSSVEFRGGRPVQRNGDIPKQGRRGSLGENKFEPINEIPLGMRRRGSGYPATLSNQQSHRNSAGSDENNKFFGSIPPAEQSQSGNEEVYEFDESMDIGFHGPPIEVDSKYPIISL